MNGAAAGSAPYGAAAGMWPVADAETKTRHVVDEEVEDALII